MKKILFLLLIGILLLQQGCHHGSREGITVKDNVCYLRFMGDVNGVEVSINDGEKFVLPEPESKRPDSFKPRNLYQLTPGKHTIKIFRNGELILNRIVYIGQNETKEVQIP